MREMKDSGIAWIGEIPREWKVVPHKYIMHKKKEIQEHYSGEDIISLTMKGAIVRDLSAGGKIPLTFDGYQKVYKGNLLQCLFDIDVTPRCVGLIRNDGVTSPAYSQFEVHKEGFAPYYDYLLRYMDDNKVLLHLSKNLRSSLTEKDFGTIPTIIPSLSEQHLISSYLDAKCSEIDSALSLQEQMISELRAYKQSLITEVVTHGLNPNAKMKNSGVEWIGEVPEGWEVRRLKTYATQRNEKEGSQSLSYIGLENVPSFSKGLIVTENQYDTTQANICRKDDVIYGKLRPYLGKALVVENDSYCSSEFVVLKVNGSSSYCRYTILSSWFIEIVNGSTYGTKMPRANADFILNMLIPVPPLSEQQAIASFLDEKCAEIDALIVLREKKMEALKEYKKSLIYECVTGKKQVI